MVFPRQRASILEARAQAERSLKHYASLIARVRQALKQREPDIQKAVSAAALRLRASRAPGVHSWTAVSTERTGEPTHEAAGATFGFRVTARPDCRVDYVSSPKRPRHS